jgi:hypothetical protein
VKPDTRKSKEISAASTRKLLWTMNPMIPSTAHCNFGIFSFKELTEGEEIVISWEWDDAHRAYPLPKLLPEEARILLERDTVSFS